VDENQINQNHSILFFKQMKVFIFILIPLHQIDHHEDKLYNFFYNYSAKCFKLHATTNHYLYNNIYFINLIKYITNIVLDYALPDKYKKRSIINVFSFQYNACIKYGDYYLNCIRFFTRFLFAPIR